MKHRIGWFILPLAVLFSFVTLSAQDVAEDVLKGKEIQGIEFKNYVGPHKVIESRQSIQGIGADLGKQVKGGSATADYAQKYRIQRVFDPASPLLSADLFVLDANAGVDHIRNLNWILSAYLQQVFGYPVADADLLADFITRYNAFYRGKLTYFPTAFSPLVTALLVPPENTGISLDYRDWPGKTRILIPLRSSLSKGKGGSVNTEEISNKDIVKDLGTDQAALDARKKLADLKEGEIVQEQKAIAQKEAQLNNTTTGTTTATGGQTPNTQSTATPTVDTTKTTTDTAKTAATNTTAASTTGTATTATATAGTTTAATTTDVAAAKAEVAAAKADVAQRDAALQAERKDIVAAEQKKADTPVVAAVTKPATTTAVVLVQDATKLGQVELIDPAANKVWKKSDLNTVRQARVQAFADGLLVTAGDTKGSNGAIRLLLLSKDDLSITLTGADDVAPDAPVLLVGTQVLTLTKNDKGLWVLGLFDTKLKSVVKGTDTLLASTGITVATTGIFVQGSNGKLLLLDAQTLKKKSDTEG